MLCLSQQNLWQIMQQCLLSLNLCLDCQPANSTVTLHVTPIGIPGIFGLFMVLARCFVHRKVRTETHFILIHMCTRQTLTPFNEGLNFECRQIHHTHSVRIHQERETAMLSQPASQPANWPL